jgi:hypothetical protein
MLATFDDCPRYGLSVKQIDRLRYPVFSRSETQNVLFAAHSVDAHWAELDRDVRAKLKEIFVTDYDAWLKHYKPRPSQIIGAMFSIWRGDNFRYTMAMSQIMASVRRHVREDELRGKHLAERMKVDPTIAEQVRQSGQEFAKNKFVVLSAEQIKARSW